MNTIIINGKSVPVPFPVVNYKDDVVYKNQKIFKFVNKPRPAPQANAVVVHETVTDSWVTTVAVLKARGLGVHFIVDEDGMVVQHADILTDEMWHATQFNQLSVGIETVNPYTPPAAPVGPWKNVIANAPWAVDGHYLVPTETQAESVSLLVDWLSSSAANPVAIPQIWPGFQHTQTLSMGRIKADLQENPGIHAHMYFGHADGAWLVLYAWLRLEVKLDAATAYTEAIRMATGAHSVGIDMSGILKQNPTIEV